MLKKKEMDKSKVLGLQGKGFFSTSEIVHFPCDCGWGHVCSHTNLKFLLKKSSIPEDVELSTLIAKGCIACSADADIVLKQTSS